MVLTRVASYYSEQGLPSSVGTDTKSGSRSAIVGLRGPLCATAYSTAPSTITIMDSVSSRAEDLGIISGHRCPHRRHFWYPPVQQTRVEMQNSSRAPSVLFFMLWVTLASLIFGQICRETHDSAFGGC